MTHQESIESAYPEIDFKRRSLIDALQNGPAAKFKLGQQVWIMDTDYQDLAVMTAIIEWAGLMKLTTGYAWVYHCRGIPLYKLESNLFDSKDALINFLSQP